VCSEAGERGSRRYTSRVRSAATAGILAAVILGALTAPARADDAAAAQLGAAYRAYDAGDLAAARTALAALDDDKLANRDYALWLRGQVALAGGDPRAAITAFTALAKVSGSRWAAKAPWRLADARWELGETTAAAKAYTALLATPGAEKHADLGAVRFRLASVATGKAATSALRAFLLAYPRHPLAPDAERRLVELAGERAARFTAKDRIERAKQLTVAHLWHESIAELGLIPDDVGVELRHQRDYWTGITLFKMRRRYADAGRILLDVHPHMGGSAAEALFHGARALSRGDHDDEAIVWYRKVVEKYPKTRWAEEASYLAGWLEFNRGNYAKAIAPLEAALAKYPSTKWSTNALWFLGMSHYLLGQWDKAEAKLATLGKRGRALEGGKGQYWLARTHQRQGKADAALATYRSIVGRWPFSWYAMLARARLAEAGVAIGVFGDDTPAPGGPALPATLDRALAKDRLIQRADELIVAGLGIEAGDELEREERAFIKRHDRAAALATLLDRYRAAGNFNRPWMIAVVHGGRALDGPAKKTARVWWEHAYPRAYQALIEKHQAAGGNPPLYLYSIMRKESGFDPHILSYADAQGLLQMIPATTIRVAKTLGLPYDAGRLYDPEFNVQTGAWYIGTLLSKFKGQIPIGAGSFNSGPRPVMRWCELNGDREIDEFVELVSYTQTREYMKKVTENYARYLYLYEDKVYDQPLAVDKYYRVDDIIY
jgi:soluble lytic murein transglycosylase